MKQKVFGLLVFLALTLAACSSASTPAPAMTVIVEPGNLPKTEAEVPRVTVEDAYSALNSGEAVILDVRSTDAFLAGHIAGALSIPLNRIEDTPKSVTLDKDQWIITYCT